MLAVLDIMMTLFASVLGDASGSLFGVDGSFFDFAVQAGGSGTVCTPKTCPGSFYTAITTAWANIGYLTHSDVLRFINTSRIGQWAILLYIAAAITGLIGVATNSPMRNYTWFFIGPALYSFLVGTTMEVQGVNWVVANKATSSEGMAEVWRNAEAGLANTRLALDGLIKINGKNGPDRQYEVAMPMVFLDELFSATSNILIEWTGIGRQVDNGGAESNLSATTVGGRQATEAWWLLSNMKWGYIENITASTIRNPDLRDALITFLASECGDQFKQGIDSGAYIAATQARGATVVDTVMVENSNLDYQKFGGLLSNVFISTPRSLGRLYKETKGGGSATGTFMQFSPRLNKAVETGRTYSVSCSEYLWTIIQGLRFEAGNAYYQMLRSAPNGFDEEGFVTTLLYGWDARETQGKDIQIDDQKAFLKHLILAYILRNELIGAPQITSVDQRYAPAEQARSYSEANIRAYGSKGKFIELYNAAVMMPYLQGILAYFLIVSYPFACMLVILPGHYKGFFTWVSFFAWIKLWDVGFAMVHVLERSVWAMIGNHSHMAATARTLILTAKKVGGVGVENPVGPGMGSGFGVLKPTVLEARAAIPRVCSLAQGTVEGQCAASGVDQDFQHAWELFDRLLLTGANLDLDLSNGWYIYIMAALYTAVPAVTGQLVLGAKAGSAGLIKDAFQGAASDGSQAARMGAQGQAVNALQSNQGSLGQAAYAKAQKQSGLAAKSFAAANKASDLGLEGTRMGQEGQAMSNAASAAGKVRESFGLGNSLSSALVRSGTDFGTGAARTGAEAAAAGGATKGAAGAAAKWGKTFSQAAETLGGTISNAQSVGGAAGNVALARKEHQRAIAGLAANQEAGWNKSANDLQAGGLGGYSRNLDRQADFEAQSAAWEARNAFASHASAMAGIAGMNAGSMSPGSKPQDLTGMAMAGELDSYARAPGPSTKDGENAWARTTDVLGAAAYSGTAFQDKVDTMRNEGLANYGSSYVTAPWTEVGGAFSALEAEAYAAKQSLYDPGANNGEGEFTARDNFYDAEADHSYSQVQEKSSFIQGARDRAGLPYVPPPPPKK